MATFAHISRNAKGLSVVLVTSVVTAMILQRVDPAAILAVCLLPWFFLLFYHHSFFLILLWVVLLFPTMVFPYIGFDVGPIYFLPMDPAYFFAMGYIAACGLAKPKEFVKAIMINPFLTIFLVLVILFTIIYTPEYGKRAIGEARKYYFFFLFPLLTAFFIRGVKDIRRLLLATFVLAIGLLPVSLLQLIMGSSLRDLASADTALFYLFTVFSITLIRMNNSFIINRTIDFSVMALCLAILIMTQHRSVTIAGIVGLFLLFWFYRNRILVLSKIIIAAITIFVLIGIVIMNVPAFERITMHYLKGITAPSSDTTASWRMRGWRQQLNSQSTQEFLFGGGLGSYFLWFDGRQAVAEIPPHNGYVQIILKFGLMGLIIYVLLACTFFWKVITVRKKLPQGFMKAIADMSLLNFGAGHAFLLGYGFCPIMFLFYAMGIGVVQLISDHRENAVQDSQRMFYDEYNSVKALSFEYKTEAYGIEVYPVVQTIFRAK